MNSQCNNVEQLKLCSPINSNHQTQTMQTPTHQTDTTWDESFYTIEWSDIENAEIDYENYLSDIENFFKEDFEKDTIEENIS